MSKVYRCYILITMLQGIVYTLLVEFVLLVVVILITANRQIKEDNKTDFRFWEDM